MRIKTYLTVFNISLIYYLFISLKIKFLFQLLMQHYNTILYILQIDLKFSNPNMDFAFLYITSIFFIIIFVIIYTVCREKRPKQIHDSSSSHSHHNHRNGRRSTTGAPTNTTSTTTSSSSNANDLSLISSNRFNSNNQQILQMDPLIYNTSFNSNNIQKLQDGLPSYEEATRVKIEK